MEPARSDNITRAPGANGDDRGGRRQHPQPTSAYPALALWPWTFPTGSRPVPVVGPTEALRGRAVSTGIAAPSGAAPILPDPAQRSSWQLAQDVWQQSGVTWERTAPELADAEPAAVGWLPNGEPASVARPTYMPSNTDRPDPEPAYFEPAYLEPSDPGPTVGAWLPDPDPQDQESVGFEAPTANAWADYTDVADADREDPQSAGFQPPPANAWAGYADLADAHPEDQESAGFRAPTANAWAGYADLADADPEDQESAGFRAPTANAWAGYADLADADPEDPQSADYERTPADAWSGGPEPGRFDPAASDGWAVGRPADDTDFGTNDHAGSEPVADGEFRDPGGAATWFTGVGPADSRFVDARSAGPGPADAERDNPMRPGSPDHQGPVGSGPGQRPQRPGPAWNVYPPAGFPGQAWPVGAGRMPLGAPVALDPEAPESVNLTEPFSAAEPDGGAPGWAGGASFGESDELFRAWQGSVNEAAAARRPWSVPRRAASASRRRRALQAAAIGVPVVVIVTVGAGALMMLTGKANEMLAVRADTGAASPAATGTSGTQAARPTAAGVPSAFVSAALSGYPGQRGTVTVASMMAAGSATVAVGTADDHPAIWRRASNGSWTLESTASLSAVTGSAGLASVADGPAGWIAVGATSDGRSTEPVVLASADGVHWQPVTSLTAQAGTGTEFLGVAAGRSGYVVVGRQMVGGRTFAVLWYSADLRSWTSDDNDGLDGRLSASTANAITATADGFVAVGSHGADPTLWVSADGQHWRLDSMSPPAGAASATLSSVAASGANVVAGGYAATRAGDIPVVVVSADGGGQWRQVVLQAPDGLGLITALTATPRGFTAAGIVGRSGAQHAVTWTSPNGLAWSGPAQAPGTEITALALTGGTVAGAAEQGATPTLVPLPGP